MTVVPMPQQKPSPFQLIGGPAIFAELEAPDYVIDKVIRAGTLTELVAYGMSGKSWLGADAALAVATAGKWLGRFKAKGGAALYLDYENGSYEMRRRFQAVAKARGITRADLLALCSMPACYMSEGRFASNLAPVIEGRSFVVIDTLKAANPGVDENDSNMRTGLDQLRRLGEKLGTAFLVLLHAKKMGGSTAPIDPREAGRGSSSIYDAADLVLHVEYRKGQPLTVQQTKARLGKPVDPFQVAISDTEDGGVLVEASDAPEAAQMSASAEFYKLCDEVLEVIRKHPGCSGRIVRANVKGRAQLVMAALDMLERHGAIRNSGSASRQQWFPTGKPGPSEEQPDEWSDVADG